jgi:hypothetical protein
VIAKSDHFIINKMQGYGPRSPLESVTLATHRAFADIAFQYLSNKLLIGRLGGATDPSKNLFFAACCGGYVATGGERVHVAGFACHTCRI